MLPENLIPERFHISAEGKETGKAEAESNLTQGKRTLSDFEGDVLAAATRSGQSRNMLLEERDRHITDRLFRVVKIETFARVLNDLQEETEIDPQELSQIIAEKAKKINEEGNTIWLNLITRDKTAPMFYDLGED